MYLLKKYHPNDNLCTFFSERDGEYDVDSPQNTLKHHATVRAQGLRRPLKLWSVSCVNFSTQQQSWHRRDLSLCLWGKTQGLLTLWWFYFKMLCVWGLYQLQPGQRLRCQGQRPLTPSINHWTAALMTGGRAVRLL